MFQPFFAFFDALSFEDIRLTWHVDNFKTVFVLWREKKKIEIYKLQLKFISQIAHKKWREGEDIEKKEKWECEVKKGRRPHDWEEREETP